MRLLLTALLAWIVLVVPMSGPASAAAVSEFSDQSRASLCRKGWYARAHRAACRRIAAKQNAAKAATPAQQKPAEPPTRPDLTAAEQDTAGIPGIPDARFWADSEADFIKALPTVNGPWINLSTGGGDGAFGAGLLNGWTQSGKRPQFALVTGV